mgnify:CR=1 FL=1
MAEQAGKVYLIGSGPGDAAYLTMQARDLLAQAQVVVYDALVDAELVDLIPEDCLKIDVGKRGGQPSTPQAEINRLLVEHCQQGKSVVRLKNGDPFIFGRAQSEIAALTQAQCDYEVIPGLSSALVAPLMAGIPLTDPQLSSSFTVFTAHDPDSLNWVSLARMETLVALMGAKTLPEIVRRLRGHGRSPYTPVAVIRYAGRSQQQIWEGTLLDILEKTQGQSLSPCVIVIGEVVKLRAALSQKPPKRRMDETVLSRPEPRPISAQPQEPQASSESVRNRPPTERSTPTAEPERRDRVAPTDKPRRQPRYPELEMTTPRQSERPRQSDRRMASEQTRQRPRTAPNSENLEQQRTRRPVSPENRRQDSFSRESLTDIPRERLERVPNDQRADIPTPPPPAETPSAEPLYLTNKTVLVTRAASQSSQFTKLLQQEGATVIEMPTLEIVPPSSWRDLDRAIAHLDDFDWLILTSTNGVDYFFERLEAVTGERTFSTNIKIAVVGEKTARRLEKIGIPADFIPPDFVADSLVANFPEPLSGLRILFPRVESGGREVLVKEFTSQGAKVREVAAYESRCPVAIAPRALEALENRAVDIITFASSKTVQHFCQLLEQEATDWQSWLEGVCIASIGPQTSKSCETLLGRVDVEATEFTLDGLTRAIVEWATQPEPASTETTQPGSVELETEPEVKAEPEATVETLAIADISDQPSTDTVTTETVISDSPQPEPEASLEPATPETAEIQASHETATVEEPLPSEAIAPTEAESQSESTPPASQTESTSEDEQIVTELDAFMSMTSLEIWDTEADQHGKPENTEVTSDVVETSEVIELEIVSAEDLDTAADTAEDLEEYLPETNMPYPQDTDEPESNW